MHARLCKHDSVQVSGHVRGRVYMFVRVQESTCVCACVPECMCACMHVCICACVHVRVFARVRVRAGVYTCAFTYTCAFRGSQGFIPVGSVCLFCSTL